MNKNTSIYNVHSYVAKSIEEKPPKSDNIRITIWQENTFVQYIDVPSEFSDSEISELCEEVFDKTTKWEHFSQPWRYTGSLNQMPPATGDALITRYF